MTMGFGKRVNGAGTVRVIVEEPVVTTSATEAAKIPALLPSFAELRAEFHRKPVATVLICLGGLTVAVGLAYAWAHPTPMDELELLRRINQCRQGAWTERCIDYEYMAKDLNRGIEPHF